MNNNKTQFIKLTIILLAFILHAQNSVGQDFEMAGVSSVTYPNSGLKGSKNSAEFSFQEYGALINIPYKLKNDKTVLINGMGYAWVESSGLDGLRNQTIQNKEQLHALYYQLMLFQKLKADWNLFVNLKPTIASDFEERLSGNDFVFQGAGIAIKKVNEHFSVGGGIAYTIRFGKPKAMPVLPLNYKKGKHSISALLPLKSIYNYSIGKKEKLSIGVKHIVNGAQFNVTTPNVEKYGFSEIDKIGYTRANVGAAINYDITKFLRFEVYGGASIRRQYELFDTSNRTHKYELKETPFIQFGLTIVSPNNKKGK